MDNRVHTPNCSCVKHKMIEPDKSSGILEQVHKVMSGKTCAESAEPKWQDKTQGGYPVRIYAVDGAHPYTIHGATYKDGEWYLNSWRDNGLYLLNNPCSEYNLVPVKKTKRVFKTLDELAKDYSFLVEGVTVTVYINGDARKAYRYVPNGQIIGITSPDWDAIFTKEVEE
jgi:hypothetical protein